MKQAWLQHVDWQTVIDLNAHLCAGGGALHKPTSDGYDQTQAFWEACRTREMTLAETVEVCRRCHRMAPFCNYNGNTFVAVIRDVIRLMPGATAAQVALLRSLTGHMVAGTATPEETAEFSLLLDKIEQGTPDAPPPSFRVGDRVQTPKGTLTGTVTEIKPGGSIVWVCDQTGASMIATVASLRPATQ